MKKLIVLIAVLVAMFAMIITAQAADGVDPVTTLTLTGVDGSDPAALIAGQKVKATIVTTGLDTSLISYQYTLDYNPSIFEVDSFNYNNYPDINTLMPGATNSNDIINGSLAVFAATGALQEQYYNEYLQAGSSTELRPITALDVTFTVKAGVAAGDYDFAIRTKTDYNDDFYEVGQNGVQYQTSTGALAATATIVGANSVTITDAGSGDLAVPDAILNGDTFTDGSITRQFNVTAIDNAGAAMPNPTPTWDVALGSDTDPSGVTIDSSGVLTVTSAAEEGTYSITAAVNTDGDAGTADIVGSIDVEINKAAARVAHIMLSTPPATITVPADAATDFISSRLGAVVYNQFGVESYSNLDWTITKTDGAATVNGITIAEDDEGGNHYATVTVAANSATVKAAVPDTTAVSFTVTATDASVSNSSIADTATITIARDTAAATTVKIYKGTGATATEISGNSDTIIIPLGDIDNDITYSAKAFDQYSTEMADSPSLAFAGTPAVGVDVDTSITAEGEQAELLVDNTASPTPATGNTFTLTAILGDKDKAITLNLVKIAFEEADGTAITAATTATDLVNLKTGTITFGDTWGEIITSIKDDNIVAKVGLDTIEGTYRVRGGNGNMPTLAANGYDILFTSTPVGGISTYTDIPVYTGTINVAQKAITVSGLTATNRDYEAENTTVAITGTATPTPTDLVTGFTTVNITTSPTSGTISTADAGDGKAVDIDDLILAGTDAANYTLTQPSLTVDIAKATITGIATAAPSYVINATHVANTDAAALKAITKDGADFLPANVTVNYGTDKTANLPITWENAAETYNPQGATYTYIGTVAAGANFNAYTPATPYKATLTVNPVNVNMDDDNEIEETKTMAKSAVIEAETLAALGLPTASISYSFSSPTIGFEFGTFTPVYDKTLAQIKAVANAVTANQNQTITITLTATNAPAWATLPATMPSMVLTITDKFPVNVTVTAPADITYGEALGDPGEASQVDAGNGTDTGANAGFTYQYEGIAPTVYALSTIKPTNAGTYKVIATLVSETHSGSGSDTFTISKKALSNTMITAITEQFTYDGLAKTPSTTIIDGTAAANLITAADYEVSHDNNIDAGTNTAIYKLTATATGNYSGTAQINFSIAQADISAITAQIAGTNQVGNVLSASLPGIISPETQLSWGWFRGDAKIDGATDSVYILSAADSGTEISAQATAKADVNYSGTSLKSEVVAIDKMAISGAVTIADSTPDTAVSVGDKLTANISNIMPTVAQAGTYQWYRDNAEIDGATTFEYTVTADDSGKVLKVVYTPQLTFIGIAEAGVEVGKEMLPGTFEVTAAADPAIIDTVLTATLEYPATATVALNDVSIVWLRDGVLITDGGTDLTEAMGGGNNTKLISSTYTIDAADQGHTISAQIIATNNFTGSIIADETFAIAAAAPAAPALSAVAGDGQVKLNWSAPNDNGSPIIKYELSDGIDTITLNPNILSHTFSNLTNGILYTFTIKAYNAIDASVEGNATATPKAPTPTPPPSGGGSSSSAPSVDVESEGNTTTATIEVTTSTDDGVSTATISGSKMEDAIEAAGEEAAAGNDINILVEVDTPSSAHTATAKLSAEALAALTAEDSTIDNLLIASDLGTMSLPQDVLATISEQADGSDLNITIAEADTDILNDRQKDIVGDRPLYDISIMAGSEYISDFGDDIMISLPYQLADGEDAENITVYYIDDEGNIQDMNGRYDEESGMVIFSVDHLSLYMIGLKADIPTANPFSDVSAENWFYEAVMYAYQNNLFAGTSETTFSPNAHMTRAMMWTVLARIEGIDTDGGEMWYSKGQAWAIENGVSDGENPDGNISREELATMLYRYAAASTVSTDLSAYTDATNIAEWATDAMSWAVSEGLISGMTETTLEPQGEATRAQVATILMRYLSE